MKNTIKVLGVIAIVAVIGFSFAACSSDDSGGGDGATVKVVNNYTNSITKVQITETSGMTDLQTFDESIASGSSKSFSVELANKNADAGGHITLTAQGLNGPGFMNMGDTENIAYIWVVLSPGKTTTVTLANDGTISADKTKF